MRVSLAKSARSFSVVPDESVLDAALRSGLRLPYGCRGGNCGACRARLLRGSVHYPRGRPLGLADAEVAEGYILLCQARALDDLTIETLEPVGADSILVKRLPCRIENLMTLSHAVLGVFLRLPAAEPFRFEPGQYLDILLAGGRRRSLSIASPPHDARLLELHVGRTADEEWPAPLFASTARQAVLSIEGPLGQFVYRHDTLAPMLLVGGGTGLAPLKSILRHVTEKVPERQMILYWGVRSERDLYAHGELERLAARLPNFRYVAVLSAADSDWAGRRGWVHQAVLDDVDTLDRHDIYVSGPPAMVAAVLQEFPRRGARPERLFVDSFG